MRKIVFDNKFCRVFEYFEKPATAMSFSEYSDYLGQYGLSHFARKSQSRAPIFLGFDQSLKTLNQVLGLKVSEIVGDSFTNYYMIGDFRENKFFSKVQNHLRQDLYLANDRPTFEIKGGRQVQGVCKAETGKERLHYVYDCVTRIVVSKDDYVDSSEFLSRQPHSLDHSYSFFNAHYHIMAVQVIKSLDVSYARQVMYMKRYLRYFGFVIPQFKKDCDFFVRLDLNFFRDHLASQYAQRQELLSYWHGEIGKHKQLYCTDKLVENFKDRQDRNQLMLRKKRISTGSETLQLYKAWESSTSNPVNRHAELMTRARGMEEYAKELGYSCLFLTITLPSKYHPSSSKYQGYGVRDGLTLLNTDFNTFRTGFCKNNKIPSMGLTNTEPHKDGCPHLHKLVFLPESYIERFVDAYSSIALSIDGDEEGARPLDGYDHFSDGHYKYLENGEIVLCDKKDEGSIPLCGARFKAVKIDFNRGSAAGYLVKYVTKSLGYDIDGEDHKVVDDVNYRIRAWASCYAIRQFDFFGLPPVVYWRENRRMSQMPTPSLQGFFGSQTGSDLIDDLVNTSEDADYCAYLKSISSVKVDWKSYDNDGVLFVDKTSNSFKKSALPLRTLKEERLNKYGETVTKIIGLEYFVINDEGYKPGNFEQLYQVQTTKTHYKDWFMLTDSATFILPAVDQTKQMIDDQTKRHDCFAYYSNGKKQEFYLFDTESEYQKYQSELSFNVSLISQRSDRSIFDDELSLRGSHTCAAVLSDGQERRYSERGTRTRINNSVNKRISKLIQNFENWQEIELMKYRKEQSYYKNK
jgi:hypothetical protein